ncbi:homocysteine S-methyltransferase family protein [Mycobacterium sp.]|uniref:homocysteine S-methyltransferase family protein n=1 Tax=Mycobacterium sp. TaxID=1785 RepID=UPI002CAC39A2|nr:homocysteine S-methyltransferase family protein [Mycobacterium sp.]HTY35342.1 homocysteine S-methyltransferase family protein [Mycobacterium sp.]
MLATEQLPIRLDGGVATELEQAGLTVAPPWWSTRALLTEQKRRVLRGVHADYLASGAQLITANTFRCNVRALRAVGRIDGAGLAWMVHAAVGVARAARSEVGSAALIAGSLAPAEDCYRPDLVPTDDELRDEHGWLAAELVRAGVDVILIETMNSEREARIALEQVLACGGRGWVSFVCGSGGRLLSGEPAAAAASAVEADGADAVLVNCTSLGDTEDALRRIRDTCGGPIGAYPNIEDRPHTYRNGRRAVATTPEEFAAVLGRWHDELDAALLGGCCGAGPPHIAALRDRLDGAA